MYLEIENLSSEEAKKINEMFPGRARLIYSIYHEVCRIEADCTVERHIPEKTLRGMTKEEYNEMLETIATEIANECEDNAFQEMCDIADNIMHRLYGQHSCDTE